MKHGYYARNDKIELRPMSYGDIEILRKWRNNRTICRYLHDVGYISPEMQEQWYQDYLENKKEAAFGIFASDIDEGQLLGSISLYDIDTELRRAAIGHLLIGSPNAHSRNLGKQSILMVIKIGHSFFNIDEFVATVHPDNIASQKSLKSVGFRNVGSCFSAIGKEDSLEISFEDIESSSFLNSISISKGDWG